MDSELGFALGGPRRLFSESWKIEVVVEVKERASSISHYFGGEEPLGADGTLYHRVGTLPEITLLSVPNVVSSLSLVLTLAMFSSKSSTSMSRSCRFSLQSLRRTHRKSQIQV